VDFSLEILFVICFFCVSSIFKLMFLKKESDIICNEVDSHYKNMEDEIDNAILSELSHLNRVNKYYNHKTCCYCGSEIDNNTECKGCGNLL